MSAELILSNAEFQILLNQIGSKFKVDYPATRLQLFDTELENNRYELELFFQPDDFYDATGSDFWRSEQPSYSDLRQCFIASGLVQYPNHKDLRDKIKVYNNIRRKVVYCPDTNLLYNNFLSATNLLKPDEVVFIETCHKEIVSQLNYKYNSKDIIELKKGVKHQKQYFDEFINRRKKVSRLAANLALREYQRYQDKVHCVPVETPLSRDKERNDLLFIESVKRYMDSSRTFPVVLTCDKLLTDVCEAEGIDYFHLELPQNIHPQPATPKQIITLLSNLAGVLGFIKLNNMIIFGEYRGKNNLNEHKIKLISRTAPLTLERDLEICRQLTKLGIKF